jgi:hypothetical protein
MDPIVVVCVATLVAATVALIGYAVAVVLAHHDLKRLTDTRPVN